VKLAKRLSPSVVLQDPTHPAWVVVQQVSVKALFALKFLVAARMLGPHQFGVVGVALAALTIVEALSETGLAQAMVQNRDRMSPRGLGGVWTLQVIRGLLICLVMSVFAGPMARGFGIPEAEWLITLAAAVPFLRNTVNLGYPLLQREHNFRALALSESAASLLDASLALGALALGMGPAALLLGTLGGDLLKSLLSWTVFRQAMSPHFQWREIASLGRFGFWVWGTSAIAVLINHFDKFVVARWLGPVNFGLYQTSSRLAQLGITDLASAASLYLFPTLSRLHHQDPAQGQRYFRKALVLIGLSSGVLAILLGVFSPWLFELFLGKQWLAAVPVLRVQCVAMWVGAEIAVCVAYLRARGQPEVIVHAVLVQFAVLLALTYPFIQQWGTVGVAATAAIAGAVSLSFMLYKSRPYEHPNEA
jgi:O-antigen/teichoic acid export membrane protein